MAVNFYSQTPMVAATPVTNKEAEVDPNKMKMVCASKDDDPKYYSMPAGVQASINPKGIVEGIAVMTAIVSGITALIKAGKSLTEAVNEILPHASKDEKQQLETQLKAYMELDNAPAKLDYAA